MAHVDFSKYRGLYSWNIMETDKYIFHIEPSNFKDNELLWVLKDADRRYLEISKVLNISNNCIKATEKQFKYNYWIHNSEIVVNSGVVTAEENRFRGQGSASISGIDYVVYNSPWKEHINHLLHEETHLIWMHEVGEAPSILNEGVAVYVEALLGNGYDAMREKFCKVWFDCLKKEKGLLRNLMKNTYFWSVYGKIPVYTLGGAFIFYFLNKWDINMLKDVFADSYFHDEKLADLIELKTGVTIEAIEISITDWLSNI